MQTQLLIEGKLVTGEGEKQPVYNPATGELLLEIAERQRLRSTRRFRQPTVLLRSGGKPRRRRAPSAC